jgi:DNA-binding NarL/FixJ family response regulator
MKEGEKITIVLVDDHPIVRQGVIPLLQAEPDLSVIGEASDGEQAVEMILKLSPDVAILNLHMPRGDGIQVIRRVRQSNSHVRFALLTASDDPRSIEQAFRAGASAYVPKQAAQRHLIEAIHTVMEGGVCISPLVETVVEAERRRSTG